MRFLLYSFVALICSGLFLTACQPSSAPRIISSVNGQPQTRLPMPPVSSSGKPVNLESLGWQLQSGSRQKLSDLRGKVVVLDFWATNCPPCLEEIPHLVELQNAHKEKGLNIVGLHVGDEKDRLNVPAFVQKLNIRYDLGYPDQELVGFLFGNTDAIPQTFVFDREGKLTANFTGYDPQIKAGLNKAIEQALAN